MEDIEHCIDIVRIVQNSSSGCLRDESTDSGLHCVRVVLKLTRDCASQQEVVERGGHIVQLLGGGYTASVEVDWVELSENTVRHQYNYRRISR